MLFHLAQYDNIINLDDKGKALLEELYETNKDELSAVTRVDSQGIIVHTIPYNKNVIGKDISGQDHNKFIISKHEQVMSDVFTAVQGYRTVAYAVPVFEGEKYAGSLTIVSYPDILLGSLPDDSPLRKPLESIKESGTRAATVVEDLLTAAKGAASIREVHDLHELVEQYLRSPEQDRLKKEHPGVNFQLQYGAEKT